MQNNHKEMLIRYNWKNKFINSFLRKYSKNSMKGAAYWKSRGKDGKGGIHEFLNLHPTNYALINEIELRAKNKNINILDLGCNVGRVMNGLFKKGFNNLYGVDINETCKEVVYNVFPKMAKSSKITYKSFEDYLPSIEKKKFDIIYTHGATVEHVNTKFNLVKELTRVSSEYIIFANVSMGGGSYPRYWEYEFQKFGFISIKHLRPEKEWSPNSKLNRPKSLIVFKSIEKC